MTINELKELALHAAKGTAPANFELAQVDEAFADGLKEFCGSLNQFMKNRYDIFEIMVEAIDEIVPKNVIDAIGRFAEVRTVALKEKVVFKRPIGKLRARKFLTQVGMSGVYETFRLDSKSYEINTHAVGGAGTIDFMRLMDGDESLGELMAVLTDGLTNAIFVEVQKALRAALNASDRPAANKYTGNGWDASEMVKLLNVVRSYGNDAVIFACPEFLAEMGADLIVAASTNYQGIASRQDIEAIHDYGYVSVFRGAPVVKMPQSYTDETNTKTWLDPQMAYILPTGGEKVVKVGLEGPTFIKDFENRDNSMEVNAWKNIGCGIVCQYNWAIYKNTHVADTYQSPYGF